MSQIFWLRAETKRNEFRRALTPDSCEKMIQSGHKVFVEDWKESIIPTHEYEKVGCDIVPANSWDKDAPDEAIIVGLKALPDNIEKFRHTHIYFAHAYKEQDGWKEILGKFRAGGGKIIDLEYMLDENNRRVCAFGYWAGYVGAALGALFSQAVDKNLAQEELFKLKQFGDRSELIKFIRSHTKDQKGEAIVIGCKGRSGAGASDFLGEINWSVMGWDKEDTAPGGPFKEILNYDLFVNCVLATRPMPPFITKDLIEQNSHRLRMISDVSCDPDSDCNMVPLYDEATVLANPIVPVASGAAEVFLTAIDNLPSILPKESSFDFSSQLSPFIIEYSESTGPIGKALKLFQEKSQLI